MHLLARNFYRRAVKGLSFTDCPLAYGLTPSGAVILVGVGQSPRLTRRVTTRGKNSREMLITADTSYVTSLEREGIKCRRAILWPPQLRTLAG